MDDNKRRGPEPEVSVTIDDLKGPTAQLEKKLERMSRMELLVTCWELDITFNPSNNEDELRDLVVRESLRHSVDTEQAGLVAQLAVALGEADGEFTPDEIEEAQRAAELDLSGLNNYSRQELQECIEILKEETINPTHVARQLKKELGENELNDVMEFLFDISVADGVFHPKEEEFLRAVHEEIGTDPERFERQIRLGKAASGIETDQEREAGGVEDDERQKDQGNTEYGEAERARIALHYAYEKLPIDYKDVAAAIVQVEGQNSDIVTWLNNGNGFFSREESFVRIGEIVTRFDREGIEFVESLIERIVELEGVEEDELGNGKSEARIAEELAEKIFQEVDGIKPQYVWGSLKTIYPECVGFWREKGGAFSRNQVIVRIGQVVEHFGFEARIFVGALRQNIREWIAQEKESKKKKNKHSRKTKRDSGEKQTPRKDERSYSPTKSDLTLQDSVLMLHPTDRLMHTLKRVGVRTISELLEFEPENSFLRPDGDTAKEILELRQKAKKRLSEHARVDGRRGKSDADRNIDKLYGLLQQQ